MLNLGYHQNGYYWDGRKPTLEDVTEAAWTGQLAAVPAEIAGRLNAIAVYRAEFQRAFHEDATAKNVPRALSAFLRALKSGNAPYDKLEQGDTKAVSAQVKRGRKVFEQSAHCTLCHVPPLYSDTQFHSTGAGATGDHGRMDASKESTDDGKFKTPTLRDVSLTGAVLPRREREDPRRSHRLHARRRQAERSQPRREAQAGEAGLEGPRRLEGVPCLPHGHRHLHPGANVAVETGFSTARRLRR